MRLFNKLVNRIERKRSDNPIYNRRKVGKSLFLATVFILGVFTVRFGMIIATGEIKGTNLTKSANSTYYGTTVQHATRGTIYDRYGYPIAEDATSYSVIAIVSKSYTGTDSETGKKINLYVEEKNYDRIAEILNQYLGIDKADVISTLKNNKAKDGTELYQVEFGIKGKNISLSTKEKIVAALDKENIKGIDFEDHPARMYPNGQFASHFIGLAQLKDSDDDQSGLTGSFGLEAAYNDILSGTDGVSTYQKDSNGNPIANTYKETKKVENGEDVYTTLDMDLQSYLETLMDQLQESVNAKELTATLMTADTGEVLATSQRPTFNADTQEGLGGDDFVWSNLLIQSNFEPGSTMKIFTTAAAQNEGKFDPDGTYTAGTIKVADTEINDWDYEEGARTLTFQQALSNSSNVGMVTLEQKLTDTTWRDYLSAFGFGSTTNSGLGTSKEAENTGSLPTENVVDTAMSAYGQAINVTQIQMLRGLTAVSNDGKMVEPHFVSKIANSEANTENVVQQEVVGQPITADTAAKTREYLIKVGTDPVYGTAYSHSKGGPIYEAGDATISVKTGTAQIAGSSGYLDMLDASNLLYSVVIMAPSDDPKYILYLTMKQPEHYTGLSMSEVTNPLLARAMETDIEPVTASSGSSVAQIEIEDYTGKSVNNVSAELRRSMVQPVIIGSGSKVMSQSVAKGKKVDPNTKLLLLSDGQLTMPDVTDWNEDTLAAFEKLADVKLKISGSGKASAQSVKAGTDISAGQTIEITLSE